MTTRSHVPPPDSASSPNGAPGREFWLDRDGGLPDADCDQYPAIVAVAPDPSVPNLTRQVISDQLYGRYIIAGNDPTTARALADARALAMTS